MSKIEDYIPKIKAWSTKRNYRVLTKPRAVNFPILIWREDCGWEIWEKPHRNDNLYLEDKFVWFSLPKK